MFLPFPFFWALFDQQGKNLLHFLVNEKKTLAISLFQGSRWTFQARHMNGDIGFYTILPGL